ncbi:MAG: UvrD-helicase domain-containing protein [Bacteroidales bacterium]
MSLLTIYKASAGSGKTFKLTEQYLMMLLSAPSLYKNILAVTFTNKATTEMKTRILSELDNLSKGYHSEHKESIKSEINLTDSQIKDRASLALRNILHDYSRFSISTIDHFFQRVIRTFAREMGLQSGYTLETDDSEILTFVIDQVLLATEEDEQLKNWLVEFAVSRMKEGKSWDFKDSIRSLADELSKEHVKELNVELSHTVNDKDQLRSYVQFLKQEESKFENTLAAIGKKGVNLIENNQLSVTDFYQKKRGPANYFYQLASKSKYEPNSYVYKVLDDIDKLPGSSVDKSIKQQIENIADQL